MVSTANSSTTHQIDRFQLPGLNLPANWTPQDLFHTALSEVDIDNGSISLRLTPLRESTMLHIMNILSDKPGWEVKVFDDAIAENWKKEMMATEGRDVTKKMADWIIAELRYKAQIFKDTGTISVYDGDVVKSDIAVSPSIKAELQAAVSVLENIPDVYKDYHPGSDGKVLDLVHPSLFPLIYGRSRILPDSLTKIDDCVESYGKGVVIRGLDDKDVEVSWEDGQASASSYSKNFQWLPSEVEFPDGNAKFTSYINNLHPINNKHLYSVIEKVIDKTIPLWNRTLTPLKDSVRNSSEYDNGFIRIPYSEQEWESTAMGAFPNKDDWPQYMDGEAYNHFRNRTEEWERSFRRVKLPEPGQFEAPKYPSPELAVDLKGDYGQRGLQIIVKLANIELTPEKPDYEGGNWHVEGQLNEHICATALYYYDNENITDSHLAFRQSCIDSTLEMGYEQDEHDFMSAVFGCEPDGPAVQEVGSVLCKEGRLLTFPNILQHRVLPFKLADATKPGHRKILALFLVDPGIRIISTANVPPQQRDWWSETVLEGFQNKNTALGKLSAELNQKIFEDVEDFPIGMEEAKEVRSRLMEERGRYVVHQGEHFEKNTFFLCEH